MDDARYDAAMAAGCLVLEIFDTSLGATKPELLSMVVTVILHAMEDADRRHHVPEPSTN